MNDVRNLIFVLGDQLNIDASAFDDFDKSRDVVVMAEVGAEITRYPNHVQRVVLFFAAMRHFRDRLKKEGFQVVYQQIEDAPPGHSLSDFLCAQIRMLNPSGLIMTEPGRFDLEKSLETVAEEEGLPFDLRPDNHFICSREAFKSWAKGHKSLVMEYFYRTMRKEHGYLMEGDKPVGGSWNYDKENRAAFGKEGPAIEEPSIRFKPDALTHEVINTVTSSFPDLYGSVEQFDWPVTVEDAQQAVDDFVANRLPNYGDYQDAMWKDEPFLYHARLSAALNLKLLDPQFVIDKVLAAYDAGNAPLNAVEGFVRQVLGWREFIRGVYWLNMPGYDKGNALDAKEALPDFFWTGDTDMHCMQQVVGQILAYGYAHHIQRLMVTGLFSLLYGVEPKQIHDWYMAMYVDSIEWVTMPNTIGMSQYADGGIVGTKPYVATGKYIKRMSNYCERCSYNPDKAIGEDACPFTTLYWTFLIQHEDRLGSNHRMRFQFHNLKRKSGEERVAILNQANLLRQRLA